MSEYVDQMIADCESKLRTLGDMVEKLRWFQHEFPHTAAAIAPIGEKPTRTYARRAGPAKAGLKIKAAKKNDRQTDRARTAPRRPSVRSLPDGAESELTAIQEALRNNNPLAPGALAATVKLTAFTLRRRVDELVKRGIVTRTGTGPRNQLVHLGKPGSYFAKDTSTKPNGSMPAVKAGPSAAPSTSPLSVVEERDRAVLQLIKDAHRIGRTVRELAISRSDDSHGAIEASITRLRVKKLIEMDDNGRWTAA